MQTANIDDVHLVVSTSGQLELLKHYVGNYVRIDSTYGVINGTKCKLTALIVINEFGKGNVAASFVTKRLDSATWKKCLNTLRDKLGAVITPNVFMMDDDSSYYNAWVEVMGEPVQRLISAWHVWKSWMRHVKI